MERHFTFEVKVILQDDEEASISDKRSLIFNNIMAAVAPIAAGTQVSELSTLKERI